MTKIFNSPYAKTQVINVAGATISYKAYENGILGNPNGQSTDTSGQSLPFGVQMVNLQVQRPIQQSFGIAAGNDGKPTRYLYMGQTTGSLVLRGLFGPSSSISDFAEALEDGCKSLTFWITPSTSKGCAEDNNATSQTLKVFGCTLESFNFQYQMGQGGIATIRYPLQFRLTGLQIIKPTSGNTQK